MTNPFKPGSGLYPPYFAGRERENKLFAQKLNQTINGSPMHMAIVGDWATGKTSLLKRFGDLAEQQGCFVSNIISPVTDSPAIFVETISNTIADDLRRKDGASNYKRIRDKLDSLDGISLSAFGFGASIERSKMERTSPQFDLRIGLRTIWESISPRYKAMVLLIDDFDLLTQDNDILRKIMVTYRNSLMEAIKDDVKIMCVVSGSRLFEQFEQAHGPLIRFFEPFELSNLEKDEARKAITEPLQNEDTRFTDEVVEKILDLTQGQPYYLQEFCYILYENKMSKSMDMNLFNTVYSRILHDLGRKMWQQKIHEMGDISIQILYLISKGSRTSEEIISQSKEKFNLKQNNVRVTLTRLQRSGHISRIARGEYELNDKLLGEYITTLFFQ